MTHLQSTIAIALVLVLLGTASAIGQSWDREGTHFIFVAKKGGDFNSIQAAIDSVTSFSGDRYLIFVAPGIYKEQVTLKPHVDIAGAGRGLTKIQSGPYPAITTEGLGPNEVRSLTVECESPDGCVHKPEALTIKDVTIRATGDEAVGIRTCCGDLIVNDVTLEILPTGVGSGYCVGIGLAPFWGGPPWPWECYSCNPEPVSLVENLAVWGTSDECSVFGAIFAGNIAMIKNSTVSVEGDQESSGIRSHWHADVALNHVSITSSGNALSPVQGYIEAHHSRIGGNIYGYDLLFNLYHSELAGRVIETGGDSYYGCFNVHDGDGHPLNTSCNPMIVADFFAEVIGLGVKFWSWSSGDVSPSYFWDFGDGSATSTEEDPTHTYSEPGSYFVTLVVEASRYRPADSVTRVVTVGQ